MTKSIPILVYAGQSNASLSFAEGHHSIHLAKRDISSVVIDTSVGSTGFSRRREDNWNPFPEQNGRPGSLYSNLFNKINHVSRQLETADTAADVKAVLWVHGESDAHRRSGTDYVDEYSRCLEKLYLDIRDACGPEVKLVIQTLSSFAPRFRRNPHKYPNWRPIAQAQREMSEIHDNIALIDADSVLQAHFRRPERAFKDGLHYSPRANAVFAEEFVNVAFSEAAQRADQPVLAAVG